MNKTTRLIIFLILAAGLFISASILIWFDKEGAYFVLLCGVLAMILGIIE